MTMRGDGSSAGRGQTTQDFAIGISIFLLTVAFVFAFVPSIFAPFDSEVSDDLSAQSDRGATAVLTNTTVEGKSVEINDTKARLFFDDSSDLQERLRLPPQADINITMYDLGEERVVNTTGPVGAGGSPATVEYTVGDRFRGQAAASTIRIVTTTDPSTCNPGCRLVVRVW